MPAVWDVTAKPVRVLDSVMHVRSAGGGVPVVLLHGNPTSSYLWRHVLGRATDGIEWIAPDLIGMGASGKPDLAYRFADHVRYLDALLDALGLEDVVLVGHDWGAALALDVARRRPVRGVAVMEGHLRPLDDWSAFDDGGRTLFQDLRTEGVGERMVLEDNFFIETLLPAAVTRPLTSADLEVYREPYREPRTRLPMLQWAREIPVAGEPADVARRMAAGADFLATAGLPGLVVHGDPGVLVTPEVLRWCRDLPDVDVVDVGGPAGHFLPEDRPAEVAEALADWVLGLIAQDRPPVG